MESINSDTYKRRTAQLSPFLKGVRTTFDYILYDLGGGPKHIKVSHVITSLCLFLIPVTMYLKAIYGQNDFISSWTTGLYLSFLMIWPMKGFFFPDESWEHKVTYPSAVAFSGFLAAEFMVLIYFSTGYHPYPYPLNPQIWLMGCTVLYVLGALLFTISDAQKHFVLKHRKPRALFTDGFYSVVRHPNYLGQILIYISFALMAWDWIPFVIYFSIFSTLFYSNMKVKEISMSRYPEWNDYQKKSSFLIPKIW